MWLAFTPQDTLFIRDGRAFDAGVENAAQAVWPTPSTIAGAVTAAFGGREPCEVRGPVLARCDSTGERWTPFFRTPADLVRREETSEEVLRLSPAPAPVGVTTDLGTVPQWLDGAGLAGMGPQWGGWLSGSTMTRYLAGNVAVEPVHPKDASGGSLVHLEADPVDVEPHVGLARGAERTARTGFLYQAAHLRLRQRWGFLAECVVCDGWDAQRRESVPFGGRGRLAWVEQVSGVNWPQAPSASVDGDAYPDGRVAVYVATPALWPEGWMPPLRTWAPGSELVAAAVGDAQPVATATPGERGARPMNRMLRWAVPAGSVYFLKFADSDHATTWAQGKQAQAERQERCGTGVHGTAFGRDPKDRLRTAGFGVVLTGVWK
ncbi:type III-B CRISPR module-associated protein Cmr3 [Streptomyces chiangmaiensis]